LRYVTLRAFVLPELGGEDICAGTYEPTTVDTSKTSCSLISQNKKSARAGAFALLVTLLNDTVTLKRPSDYQLGNLSTITKGF
jgi:hypothetical protein